MSRSESSPPSPSPGRRSLKIRRSHIFLVLGALVLAAGLLFIITAGRSPAPPPPADLPAPAAKADSEFMVVAAIIQSWLSESRDSLKKGNLLAAYELHERAETAAQNAARRWPNEPSIRELARLAGEAVLQYEKYGGADPPPNGQTVAGPNRYPDEPALPGAGQVNDLFVAGWASEKRGQPEAAIGIYNQALDRLDELLRSGGGPAPAAVEPRHSDVPVPPSAADRSPETRYLKKYYAAGLRLADLESKAGHEDRAEAVRRRALAALDQALARGADTAELSRPLDSLLSDLARRERQSGRLESARLTLQRRLGLMQYMSTHASSGASPTADGRSADAEARPDTGLGSAQLPPSVALAENEAQSPANTGRSSASTLLELAWLDRHIFHYDEGLEYLAEILDKALENGPVALTETDRQARLIRGEMLMDLGHFPEAELALQEARPYLNRHLDSPQASLVGRVDIEPRVTTIRANLALAELQLSRADPALAEQYMEEAVNLYRTLPGGHPVTFDVQLTRVKVLARKGDSQRAERELAGFLADSSKLLESPEVDIWVKRQILALMAEAAWQAQARGERELAIEHYRRVNDELTPYITGIEVDKASEYGSLFRPILVEIMEGEGDLLADLRRMSQAESRYVLGLDMARALRDQEPRQYFWRTRFESLAGKVERFHY